MINILTCLHARLGLRLPVSSSTCRFHPSSISTGFGNDCYAARASPKYEPYKRSSSSSKSRSRSPENTGKVMYITSFGGESEEDAGVLQGPSLPPDTHHQSSRGDSKGGGGGSSRSWKSTSRSSRKPSSSSRYRHRSRSPVHNTGKHRWVGRRNSRSRSASSSHSRSRSRSRSKSRSPSPHNKTRCHSKSKSPAETTAVATPPKPIVKRYRRSSLSSSAEDSKSDSDSGKSPAPPSTDTTTTTSSTVTSSKIKDSRVPAPNVLGKATLESQVSKLLFLYSSFHVVQFPYDVKSTTSATTTTSDLASFCISLQ
ncbi:SFRS16 [Acanthosepion pharaonis]|uniref:SFRS16 n=1 Tax=Acanthosepion pharaonis TaxID=158019 RepID=A0A812DTZ2_ACAPH|nr:SFRS16 [Sepia pharaonis]